MPKEIKSHSPLPFSSHVKEFTLPFLFLDLLRKEVKKGTPAATFSSNLLRRGGEKAARKQHSDAFKSSDQDLFHVDTCKD